MPPEKTNPKNNNNNGGVPTWQTLAHKRLLLGGGGISHDSDSASASSSSLLDVPLAVGEGGASSLGVGVGIPGASSVREGGGASASIANRLGRFPASQEGALLGGGVPGEECEWPDLLTSKECQVRARVREYCETKVFAHAAELWENAIHPKALWEGLGALGVGGGTTPSAYGGAGLSLVGAGLVNMELARVDGSLSAIYMIAGCLVTNTIVKLGSEAQKKKYLPQLCAHRTVGSWALTEAEAGSDASGLRTLATPLGGGLWQLDGRKRWIGNAPVASVIIIWARHAETGNTLAFAVEPGSTAGVSVKTMRGKVGLRAIQNGEIFLDGATVKEEARLPGVKSFADAAGVLAQSRVMVTWQPVGLAQGLYDVCLRHVKERMQFGVPLAASQVVQHRLMLMRANCNAMALYAWRLTRRFEQGEASGPDAALAKAWVTLRGRECASIGRELLGGDGLLAGSHVGKAFADMEAYYTYEGTFDINLLVAGRAHTGISAIRPRM